MRLTVLLAGLMVVTGALAGCIQNDEPKAGDPKFTINRQVRIEVNEANVEAMQNAQNEGKDFDPYAFVEPWLVVTITGAPVAASDIELAYDARDESPVRKSITEFTSKAELAPGDTVVVKDAHILSSATLFKSGAQVASRARPAADWWIVGGYPIGYSMDPGSTLGYAVSASASESLALGQLKAKESAAEQGIPPVDLRRANLELGFRLDGKMRLDYGADLQPIVADASHNARPLAWSSEGTITFPNTYLTVEGSNEGVPVDAGFEVLPETAGTFNAKGKLHLNESRSPVRADVDGGSYSSNADVSAWLSGVEQFAEFSCYDKTRADQCRPAEIQDRLQEAKVSGEIEPDTENLDGFPWDVQPDVLKNVTRVLAEDLVPGDEVRFSVDVDVAKFMGGEGSDGPSRLLFDLEALVKVEKYESVQVTAGAFEALKVVQSFRQRVEVGEIKGPDGEVMFKGMVFDPGALESRLWLQKDTFVPLRLEGQTPLDLGQLIRDALDSISADTWAQLPVDLDTRAIEWKINSDVSLELVEMKGRTRIAPWLSLFGLNGWWAFAAFGLAQDGFGGREFAAPAYPEGDWGDAKMPPPDYDWNASGWERPPPPTSAPGMGEPSHDPSANPWGESASLSVALTDFAIEPATLEVKPGTFVFVSAKNSGGVQHSLVFPDLGEIPPMQPGEESATSFVAPEEPGEYAFHCGIPGHKEAGMTGTLVVVAPKEPA